MLRLTAASPDHRSDGLLEVEGQIVGEWVDLLEAECRARLATAGRVRLDLGKVTYLDRRGARLLRSLTGDSLELVNCPRLVEELLLEDTNE